jgi:hypothetical protein
MLRWTAVCSLEPGIFSKLPCKVWTEARSARKGGFQIKQNSRNGPGSFVRNGEGKPVRPNNGRDHFAVRMSKLQVL